MLPERAESKLRLNSAAEFAIVCAGETTASDYALLRADASRDAKSDHRQYCVEFVTAAGTLTSVGRQPHVWIPSAEREHGYASGLARQDPLVRDRLGSERRPM